MGNLLFSPSGRISPSEFMRGAIILIVVGFVLGILPLINFQIGSMLSLLGIITLWCWIVLFIKRFHDGGKSGWMCIIPIIAFIILSMIISTIVTGMFAGDLNAQMQEAAAEAAESGDFGAIMGASMEMGSAIAKKTALPAAIAGAVVSYIIAFATNSIVGHDDHENQFGPAT